MLEPYNYYIEKYRFNKFSDLKWKIAQCDLFLGTRFHSALFAIQLGVPVLAVSYANKSYKTMTEFGLRKYVLRVQDVTFDILKKKWAMLCHDKKSLSEMYKTITQEQNKLAMGYFDLIAQTVRSNSL